MFGNKLDVCNIVKCHKILQQTLHLFLNCHFYKYRVKVPHDRLGQALIVPGG
jgi:hypothetical protein